MSRSLGKKNVKFAFRA